MAVLQSDQAGQPHLEARSPEKMNLQTAGPAGKVLIMFLQQKRIPNYDLVFVFN